MNVSFEEFMYVANGFKRSELRQLLENIKNYMLSQDIPALKRLLVAQRAKMTVKPNKFYHLNTIMIKVSLEMLTHQKWYTEDDISYLTDYLLSVEYWGYYELLLFINTLDALIFRIGERQIAELVIVLITILIYSLQYWLGYREHKVLIWILPLIFVVTYVVLMVFKPSFDFRSLMIPFVCVFSLLAVADKGRENKKGRKLE